MQLLQGVKTTHKPLIGGGLIPALGLYVVHIGAPAELVAAAQVILPLYVALPGGLGVPLESCVPVLGHAQAAAAAQAQVVLPNRVAGHGGLGKPVCRAGIVLLLKAEHTLFHLLLRCELFGQLQRDLFCHICCFLSVGPGFRCDSGGVLNQKAGVGQYSLCLHYSGLAGQMQCFEGKSPGPLTGPQIPDTLKLIDPNRKESVWNDSRGAFFKVCDL